VLTEMKSQPPIICLFNILAGALITFQSLQTILLYLCVFKDSNNDSVSTWAVKELIFYDLLILVNIGKYVILC
jgi:hypothetical protein